jgi:hypothetical protein
VRLLASQSIWQELVALYRLAIRSRPSDVSSLQDIVAKVTGARIQYFARAITPCDGPHEIRTADVHGISTQISGTNSEARSLRCNSPASPRSVEKHRSSLNTKQTWSVTLANSVLH